MANPDKMMVKLAAAIAPAQMIWAVPANLAIASTRETVADGLFGLAVNDRTQEGTFHYFATKFRGATHKTVPLRDIVGFNNLILKFSGQDVEGVALVNAASEVVWGVVNDDGPQRDFLLSKLAEVPGLDDLRG